MKDVHSDLCLVCFSELMVMLVPPAVPVLQGKPVTLRCVVWGRPKLEKAVFYKNKIEMTGSSEDTYTIAYPTQSDDGKYSCHATYRFSHISPEAAQKEGESDDQELKVIGTTAALPHTRINTEPLILHINICSHWINNINTHISCTYRYTFTKPLIVVLQLLIKFNLNLHCA